MKLLTRTQFRDAVFAQTQGACCAAGCSLPAVDAHHILERRLWDDGGYYLENGAPVCEKHHLAAEATTLSAQELRDRLGITHVALPAQLPADEVYDKWGNVVHDDGSRSPGELFWDDSVQKVLRAGGVLPLFRTRMKYPKTPHLPDSPGCTDDDSILSLEWLNSLRRQQVVVTEKMDGENTTFYRDGIHARSLDSMSHSSQDYVKGIHARVAHDIPLGWRVVGENMYATHSITYPDLSGYFLVFAIFNERGTLLPWQDVADWATLLGLPTVPVITGGFADAASNAHLYWKRYCDTLDRESEGYVVRVATAVEPYAFRHSVAKWVRPNHITTAQHGWKYRNDYRVNEVNAMLQANMP